MHNQPKVKPLTKSDFFEDGMASRALPPGTVPRGYLRADKAYYSGRTGDQLLNEFPMAVTEQVLRRGQERFNIFCSPCHGRLGSGSGMIVQRGYKQPASFHEQRLRDVPAGYFFDVISNGFATMPSYASQIPTEDRWAITAYVKALQFSQNAHLVDLTAEDREKLMQAGKPAPVHGDETGHE
jgi:mono/diheme cytochrome c family protein